MANIDRDMLLKIIALVEQIQAGGGSVDVQINGTSIVSDGVANIPVASGSKLGVVITNSSAGVDINPDTHKLRISKATDSNVKAGTDDYRPIVSSNQHSSAFYGLAKASGDATQSESANAVGTYTDGAKQKIKEMLGITVIVPITYDDQNDSYSCPYTLAELEAMINKGCYLVVVESGRYCNLSNATITGTLANDSISFTNTVVSNSGIEMFVFTIDNTEISFSAESYSGGGGEVI